MAGAASEAICRDRHRRDARPLFPGQRRRMDSGTGPRARAFPGRAIIPPGSNRSRRRLAREEKAESGRQRALAHELEWVRKSPSARRAKSKARLAAYEAMLNQDAQKRAAGNRDLYSARAAAGREGHRGGEGHQGIRRKDVVSGHGFRPAAERDHRGHRSERRGENNIVSHDHRPGES